MKSNPTVSSPTVSPPGAWLLAIRPRTLPASVSPVIVGTAAAFADNRFAAIPAVAALLGAMLLQIAVNLANDYFDHQRGIDTTERLGPLRVTQSGLISSGRVKRAMILTLASAGVIGLFLAYTAGWPVIIIGAASILAALAYSGGPYPLASHGLGDIFVFIFFGPIAVCGTYYVQALDLTHEVFWLSVPIGLLITAIMVVNNLRDIPTDAKTGKNTLAVILGAHRTRLEYIILMVTGYSIPVLLYFTSGLAGWILLPLVSAPMAIAIMQRIRIDEGSLLNRALSRTAALTLVYSLLFSAGLLMQG
jgi:1,4-dihydroxy-2-naphthoate octaprenyltransferase